MTSLTNRSNRSSNSSNSSDSSNTNTCSLCCEESNNYFILCECSNQDVCLKCIKKMEN